MSHTTEARTCCEWKTLPSGTQIEIIYQRIINNLSFGDEYIYKLSREIGYIELSELFPNIGTGLCDVHRALSLRCKVRGQDTIKLTELDCYESSIGTNNEDFIVEMPKLYPNPSQNVLKIDGGFRAISIHNSEGRSMTFDGEDTNIDVSHLPQGIYFITLQNIHNQMTRVDKIYKN